jgi:hypothetical protein
LFANDNMFIYIGFMWCFPHLDDSLEGLDIEFTFYETRMTFKKKKLGVLKHQIYLIFNE